MSKKTEGIMCWVCFVLCCVLIVSLDVEWMVFHSERNIAQQLQLRWLEYMIAFLGVCLTAPFLCDPNKKG